MPRSHGVRSKNSYPRREGVRQPSKRILIVCEGQTEEIYFKAFKSFYRLQGVVVIECLGAGHQQIVNFAAEKANAARKKGEPFDEVWCVFDTETPELTPEIRNTIQKAVNDSYNLAISNPCIEYWFILHFEKTTAGLASYEDTKKRLLKHIAIYDKIQEIIRQLVPTYLFPKTEIAINNAKNCHLELQKITGEEYPNSCTTVYLLVGELYNLKQNKPY